jgi:DNA-binding transcriptional LysR family regulator
MTLKQLEAFYWAATLGSFSAAASRLHITQSTLSKRIAELESNLLKVLFDRSGQRPILTDVGEHLLEHASQMLDIENRIRSGLAGANSIRGVCHFGVSELVVSTWFPDFVARVNRIFPNLVLEPEVDLTQRLEKRLERGDLDFAVIPGPSASPQLMHDKVGELEYRWMASPQRLPKGTLLTKAHFAKHPVITLNAEAGLSRVFDQWAKQQHLEIPRALTCNSLTALIALAIAGVGISYFPRTYISPLVQARKLVELRSEVALPNLSYCFHWRAGDTRAVIKDVRKLIQETADFSRPAFWAEIGR